MSTAIMSDLVEFYLARLDEDEAAARDASRKRTRRPHKGSGARWSRYVEGGDDGWAIESEDGEHAFIVGWPEALAVHIALHDPARVLRDVESKRRIIKEHLPTQLGYTWTGPVEDDTSRRVPRFVCSTCDWVDIDAHFPNPADPVENLPTDAEYRPCPTLRALVLSFADHPEYNESWRP